MNQDLIAYYQQRAKEYDKVYQNPLEQDDLRKATDLFQTLFAGKNILEIACGTGYWTEQISQTAASIHATDVNEQVLAIARAREFAAPVRFSIADMYALPPGETYDGVFGGFIWSHVMLQDLDRLLDTLRSRVSPGGLLVFIDSNSLENTFHDRRNISHSDAHGNTYQTRTLENGSTHLVLKNYPSEAFLLEQLSRPGTEAQFFDLGYYWAGCCRVG